MSVTKKVLLGVAAVALAGLTVVSAVAAGGEKECRELCPKSGPCPPCCPDDCPAC
jgi:hypothetical protein